MHFIHVKTNKGEEKLAKSSLNVLLQVPSRLKEALKTAKQSVERRLQEEQKMVRHSSQLTCFLLQRSGRHAHSSPAVPTSLDFQSVTF